MFVVGPDCPSNKIEDSIVMEGNKTGIVIVAQTAKIFTIHKVASTKYTIKQNLTNIMDKHTHNEQPSSSVSTLT